VTFVMTAKTSLRPCRLKALENNLVLIDSVSKRYSATGLRVRVMASKNKETAADGIEILPGSCLCPPI